ncbi:sulfotransferase domain-containing protein [Tistrella mobilis]|uniref:sulfotransferase domain-containing protein n=1 Tax=Tistrella mobilis TaxID=171437 RepID=UPI0031F6530E
MTAPRITPGDGFVWVTAYPKSGSTWLRLALWSLKHGGAAPDFDVLDQGWLTMASNRALFDRCLGLDSAWLTDDEASNLRPAAFARRLTAEPGLHLHRTHEAFTATPDGRPVFPPALTRGGLYLIRDPRDLAVSNAHHWGLSIDAAIDFLARPDAALDTGGEGLYGQLRQPLGSWSAHVDSWTAAALGFPRLIIRYEDMVADPHQAFARIAGFLGWPDDPATVAGAVAGTTFSRLQRREAETGFTNAAAPGRRFFRQGRAAGWPGALTPAQAARIEAAHGTVMARFGYR